MKYREMKCTAELKKEQLSLGAAYINGLYYCKNTAINTVSGDSTREVETVSSFAATD